MGRKQYTQEFRESAVALVLREHVKASKVARDLGVSYHLQEAGLSIVRGKRDAYFAFTVPTEAVPDSGRQVIDFSALFESMERRKSGSPANASGPPLFSTAQDAFRGGKPKPPHRSDGAPPGA